MSLKFIPILICSPKFIPTKMDDINNLFHMYLINKTTKMDDINNLFHMYLINNLEYPTNHENIKHIPY
jgi:hypothetical protein